MCENGRDGFEWGELESVPGKGVAEALTGELEKLPAEREALLLLALGDRRQPVPLPLVTRAIRSQSAPLREAAVRVLAKSQDQKALGMLFEAALGNDEAAGPAREALRRHQSEDVDALVLSRLKNADSQKKIVLLDLAGARRIEPAKSAVVGALDDRNQDVRTAALAPP